MEINWNSNIIKTSRLNLILFGLFCLFPLLAIAQDSNKEIELANISISEDDKYVTDNLRNLYVYNQNEIIKYSPHGKEQYKFNKPFSGSISTIDASNPLKILVFSEDFGEIVSLDNTLTENGGFNLYNLGYDRVDAICLSNDNNIWLFDGLKNVLVKLNEYGDRVLESDEINYLSNQVLAPNFLIQEDSWLYLNVPDFGILVFDDYGTYAKTIPIKGLNKFHINEDRITYFTENKVKGWDMKLLEEFEHPKKFDSSVIYASVKRDRLFIQNSATIQILKP